MTSHGGKMIKRTTAVTPDIKIGTSEQPATPDKNMGNGEQATKPDVTMRTSKQTTTTMSDIKMVTSELVITS